LTIRPESADLVADKLALIAEKDNIFQFVIGIQSFGGANFRRSTLVFPDD
jgi:hypothetical protein